MSTLLLNQEQIKSLLTMKDFVEITDKTFEDMGKDAVVNPAKLLLDLGESGSFPGYNGFFNAMPAYIGWLDIAGIKWAGGFMNQKRISLGLPYVNSLILLADPELGLFKAVVDGAYITTMRTGAQTAAALKYLRKKKTVKIGLYGAGAQGHTQIAAISQLFHIEELRVYDISEAAAKGFQENMKDTVKGDIIIVKDPKDAASGDVVITVTQSKTPVVKDEWIKPGTIIFPMGSYQEVSDELLLGADKIIVDHVEQCLHRGALSKLASEGKIKESDIYTTIGQLAAGKIKIDDAGAERIIVVPIGTGALDIAAAGTAYRRAVEQGIGQEFDFI